MDSPLSTDKPNFKVVSHSVLPKRLSSSNIRAVPTNTFWTGLMLNNGDSPIYVNPYKMWYNGAGFNVCYSTLTVADKSVTTNKLINLSIRDSTSQDFTIPYYDHFSVHVQSGKLRYYLVRGSPFVTVESVAARPIISSQHVIKTVTVRSPNCYRISLNNNQEWLLYHEGGLVLNNIVNNSLTAASDYTGIFRVIVVP